jgi:hypothetical protein
VVVNHCAITITRIAEMNNLEAKSQAALGLPPLIIVGMMGVIF